jgi:RHS repeat-associated protein
MEDAACGTYAIELLRLGRVKFMKKQIMIGIMGILLVIDLQVVEPVTDGLPGLPGQSDAYWVKRRQEKEEQQRGQDRFVNLREVVVKQDTGYQENEPVNFYTGKPFDMELGTYIFKFRNYSPEMQRWTTTDPSGFPDGANNYSYVSTPVYMMDPLGLAPLNSLVDDLTIIDQQISAWNSMGWGFAANVLSHFAGGTGSQYTGSSTEADLIKNASKYRDAAQAHFNSIAGQYLGMGDGTYNIGNAWNGSSLSNMAFESRWVPADDGNLFNALGGAHFFYNGTLTITNGSWSVQVTMEQADWYTFNTTEGLMAAILNAPPSGRAAYDMEMFYGYNPFWNYES